MIGLTFLDSSSSNISTKVVVVMDAALKACSNPGIRSLSVAIAKAMVCGRPCTISRISVGYRRRLSAIVVGAAACAELSSGTGLTRFVANEFPSSSFAVAGYGKLVTTCIRLDHVLSSIPPSPALSASAEFLAYCAPLAV